MRGGLTNKCWCRKAFLLKKELLMVMTKKWSQNFVDKRLCFPPSKRSSKRVWLFSNKNSTKSIILVNLSRCVCLIWWAGRLEIFKIAKSCWWTVKLDSGRLIRAKNDLNETKKVEFGTSLLGRFRSQPFRRKLCPYPRRLHCKFLFGLLICL